MRALLRRRRHLLRRAGDAGFTLIEAVASLTIATIMLTALAYTAVGGIQGSTEARINQQAGDVLDSVIESARNQSYSNLVMYASDPDLTPAKDSRLRTSGCNAGGSMCISVPNPTGSSPSSVIENIVTSTAPGFLPNHIQTITAGTNNVPFKVSTYVTTPNDEANSAYKRITVFVSWRVYGTTHSRTNSTYVTETQRGLPLPKFTLDCTTCAQSAPPGGQVKLDLKLTNSGARDSFDFTSVKLTGDTFTWSYYQDNGDDNELHLSPETPTDTPLLLHNSKPNTGLLNTDAFIHVWLVADIPSSAVPGVSTVKFTATSVAQPSLSGSTETVTGTITVTAGGGTGGGDDGDDGDPSDDSTCQPTGDTSVTKPAEVNRYYLHNQIGHSANTSSVALLGMPFTTTAPNTNVLNDFSTDDGKGSNVPGRNLVYNSSLPSITAASASTVAQWKVKVTSGNAPVLNGNVIVEVWAQNDPTVSPKNGTLALRAMVGYQAKNNVAIVELDSTAGGKVVSDTGCSGWRKYVISVPINSQTLAKNSTVVLDIFNANPSNALRLAYDTTTYPADVYWPFTSGSFSG